ncbi:MAG: DUF3786 domain-containing protein [Anaerolineae bacterium]
MKARPRTPEEIYGPALGKAMARFPGLDPGTVAARAAVTFEGEAQGPDRFLVPFFGRLYEIMWPGASVRRVADGEDADVATRILLLHYLITADGTPMASKWITFRQLPGGLGYDAAFQGRANLRLARAFGHELAAFEDAAAALGGERLEFGDAAFSFRALPRAWLAVILHLADEEFPANASVLFDASAHHYLPTEDLAVLGGMLASQLVKRVR